MPKVVVGSRAEAKALRTIAEQAERDRVASAKAAAKQAKQQTLLERHAQTVASDGTAAWAPVDAAIVLAVLVAGIVLKQLALGSRVVEVMPLSGQTAARALVLGGFYALVRDKFRVDELYDATVVRPVFAAADLGARRIDPEVIDGVVWLIDERQKRRAANTAFTDLEKRQGVMRLIPGPDFPTGGYIVGRSGIYAAYERGRGSILMRAKASIETAKKGDKISIVVTEIPYQVNKAKLIEATEAMTSFAAGNEHPQGDKVFDGKRHQVYGHQFISKVEGQKLNVVHQTSIEDGQYENDTDYTKQSL